MQNRGLHIVEDFENLLQKFQDIDKTSNSIVKGLTIGMASYQLLDTVIFKKSRKTKKRSKKRT